MKVQMPQAVLLDNDTLQAKALAKVFQEIDFDPEDFSHAEIQFFLDNNAPFEVASLYSPVLTMANLTNIEVPAGWPGSEKFDEEGESLGQKNFEEYGQYHAVTDGYCIKFSGGAKDENNNITNPTYAQVKVWEAKVNGFLTKAEFDAIKIVEE